MLQFNTKARHYDGEGYNLSYYHNLIVALHNRTIVFSTMYHRTVALYTHTSCQKYVNYSHSMVSDENTMYVPFNLFISFDIVNDFLRAYAQKEGGSTSTMAAERLYSNTRSNC
jgi:hypothetical protein